MSKEIYYSDATRTASMIRNRDVSPVEVMQAHLDRIAATNPDVNAVVTVADDALKQAAAAEAAVMKGEKLGPLHGVPFTVKDSIDTAGVLTQRGSPIFKGRRPDEDATSVARFKKQAASCWLRRTCRNFHTGLKATTCCPGALITHGT